MGSVEAVNSEIAQVNECIQLLAPQIQKAKEKVEDAERINNLEAVRRWSIELQQLRETENKMRDEKNKLLDERVRLQSAAAGGADMSGVLTVDQFQAGLQTLLEEMRKHEERKPKSFSKVGSVEAQKLLAQLDFAEESGNFEDPIVPPSDTPEAESFDYSLYPNEDAGTPALLEHHQRQLQKYGVPFGRGAFQIYDIHTNRTLYAITAPDEAQFTGTADGLLAPFGLYAESAARQCRVLFEHKQTEDQRQRYRERNSTSAGASGKSAGSSGPVQYGSHRGQALVCYLASLAVNSFPLIYDLCDGEKHNLLHLRDGFITIWEGLSPTEAYWKQAQLLLQSPVAVEKRLRLEGTPEEFRSPLKKLRLLAPSSGMLEQLDSILPFVPENERVACTQELLAPWLQSSSLPEYVLRMYN